MVSKIDEHVSGQSSDNADQQSNASVTIRPGTNSSIVQKIQLLICHVSGNILQNKDFRRKLRTSSLEHGETLLKSSTNHTLHSGKYTVSQEDMIHFHRLLM